MQEKARQGINWAGASGAARNEVLFLSHMAAAHTSAMQMLESEGEASHLTERTRRTAFITSAWEALGALSVKLLRSYAFCAPHDTQHLPIGPLQEAKQVPGVRTCPENLLLVCGTSRHVCVQPCPESSALSGWV